MWPPKWEVGFSQHTYYRTVRAASIVILVSHSQYADVKSAAILTGLPASSIYRLVADRRFPAMRIGRRLLIPLAELARYLEGAKLATADEALTRDMERRRA